MMASDRAGYCNTVTRYNGEDLADDGPPVGCSYIQAFKRPIECYNVLDMQYGKGVGYHTS